MVMAATRQVEAWVSKVALVAAWARRSTTSTFRRAPPSFPASEETQTSLLATTRPLHTTQHFMPHDTVDSHTAMLHTYARQLPR